MCIKGMLLFIIILYFKTFVFSCVVLKIKTLMQYLKKAQCYWFIKCILKTFLNYYTSAYTLYSIVTSVPIIFKNSTRTLAYSFDYWI